MGLTARRWGLCAETNEVKGETSKEKSLNESNRRP